MSSGTLQQTAPNLSANDRRVRLLEARLQGNGGGGGSSNASAESLNNNNPPVNSTHIPVMEIRSEGVHSSMKPFLIQGPMGSSSTPGAPLEMFIVQQPQPLPTPTAASPAAAVPVMPPLIDTVALVRDESNVSVKSASSENNNSREMTGDGVAGGTPVGDVSRNLSASSNSVSQMSIDPPAAAPSVGAVVGPVVDGRKRKRGKIKEPNTSPLTKPTKNVKSDGGHHNSTGNGPSTPTSRRTAAAYASDFYTKTGNLVASGGGCPSPSSTGAVAAAPSLPRSGSSTALPLLSGGAGPAGSRSPHHPSPALTTSATSTNLYGGSSSMILPPLATGGILSSVMSSSNGPSSSPHNRAQSATIATQTDLGIKDMVGLLTKQTADKQDKEKTVQSFEQKIADMSKEIVKLKHKLETSDSRLLKCVEMEKKLLSEKSSMEKKSARSKSVHNRMKLGQFVTQREGAMFEEKFLDGYSFNEIHKRMDELTAEKEELDRRRKLLLKRKPSDKSAKRNAGTSGVAAAAGASTSTPAGAPLLPNSGDMESVLSSTPVGANVSQPFASALVGVNNNSTNGPVAANWATDFIQPEVKEWTWSDYAQEDEILKLRTAQLKKDEQDCATELEKMERERLIHIRELKRIFNEDQSVFKNNPVLNQRYLLLTLIGKGGFSEVHKAFDVDEQRYVAVKVHQLIKEWKDEKKANYIKHALREYHVHKNLTHPRVVKLFDVFEIDNNSFATVLEYVEGNDLDFYLKQQKTIPEREARIMISQVVSALRYFNELKPPIIHYDLKPGNILLGHGNSSGEIKVTDFGLSKVCDDEHYDSDFGMDLTSQGAGTYWYLPPEVFETTNTPKISSKVDVWSVGVIFYQMLYGRKPYGDKQSQREVLQNFTILNARDVEFPAKPQISLEAKNFIRRCLTLRKDDRPEVRQLCADEYLQLGTKLTKGNPSPAPTTNFNSNSGPSSHYT